jgi:hypothetical protein
MSWEAAAEAAQWFFLLYLVALNFGYLALNACSILELPRHLEARLLELLPHADSGYEPPVSVLVPAYNEELTIAASVRSMLQLDYPQLEVIVINDGSRDGTLEQLVREFGLVPHPEAYWRRLQVKPVRAIYRSTRFPNLRVIDKENGGKADALNAGINAARYRFSARWTPTPSSSARACAGSSPRSCTSRTSSPRAARCAWPTAAKCAAAFWKPWACPGRCCRCSRSWSTSEHFCSDAWDGRR